MPGSRNVSPRFIPCESAMSMDFKAQNNMKLYGKADTPLSLRKRWLLHPTGMSGSHAGGFEMKATEQMLVWTHHLFLKDIFATDRWSVSPADT